MPCFSMYSKRKKKENHFASSYLKHPQLINSSSSISQSVKTMQWLNFCPRSVLFICRPAPESLELTLVVLMLSADRSEGLARLLYLPYHCHLESYPLESHPFLWFLPLREACPLFFCMRLESASCPSENTIILLPFSIIKWIWKLSSWCDGFIPWCIISFLLKKTPVFTLIVILFQASVMSSGLGFEQCYRFLCGDRLFLCTWFETHFTFLNMMFLCLLLILENLKYSSLSVLHASISSTSPFLGSPGSPCLCVCLPILHLQWLIISVPLTVQCALVSFKHCLSNPQLLCTVFSPWAAS